MEEHNEIQSTNGYRESGGQVLQPIDQTNGQANTNVAQEDTETKEVQEIKDTFVHAPRFAKWRDLYFDRENSFKLNTFGNGTLSAYYAYDLDKNDPKDRKYASELGHKNAKKCKNWARDYLSAIGTTPEIVLKTIATKALGTNNARYLQMLAEITEVYTPKPAIAIQNNTQNNIQVNDGEAKDFSKAFKDFLHHE